MQFAHLKNKVEDVESVVKKWIYVDEVRLYETGDFFGLFLPSEKFGIKGI